MLFHLVLYALQVPWPLIVLGMLFLFCTILFSFIADPITTGVSVVIFLSGMPVYYLGIYLKDNKTINNISGNYKYLCYLSENTTLPQCPSTIQMCKSIFDVEVNGDSMQ